jgi:hypothetical protein
MVTSNVETDEAIQRAEEFLAQQDRLGQTTVQLQRADALELVARCAGVSGWAEMQATMGERPHLTYGIPAENTGDGPYYVPDRETVYSPPARFAHLGFNALADEVIAYCQTRRDVVGAANDAKAAAFWNELTALCERLKTTSIQVQEHLRDENTRPVPPEMFYAAQNWLLDVIYALGVIAKDMYSCANPPEQAEETVDLTDRPTRKTHLHSVMHDAIRGRNVARVMMIYTERLRMLKAFEEELPAVLEGWMGAAQLRRGCGLAGNLRMYAIEIKEREHQFQFCGPEKE